MSKERSLLADYAVYLVARSAICVLQAVSPEAARQFASFLAWVAYRLDRRHRQVAGENLQHAFGTTLTEAARDRLVRSVYRHFCTLIAEIAFLPRKLHPGSWRRYVRLVGGRPLVEQLLSGRPVLLVTGHFGNWEMAGYALGLFGFPASAVARPLDNPFLHDFLQSFRKKTGQKILSKKGDFDQMQHLLENAGIMATLGDQDAGQRGLFVDFFGRPASTHKAIALLALEHQAPIVVILARKMGDPFRYDIIAQEVILPEEYREAGDAVKQITQRFTTALEQVIRLSPEQYFWLHRRWKHQPKMRSSKKAA